MSELGHIEHEDGRTATFLGHKRGGDFRVLADVALTEMSDRKRKKIILAALERAVKEHADEATTELLETLYKCLYVADDRVKHFSLKYFELVSDVWQDMQEEEFPCNAGCFFSGTRRAILAYFANRCWVPADTKLSRAGFSHLLAIYGGTRSAEEGKYIEQLVRERIESHVGFGVPELETWLRLSDTMPLKFQQILLIGRAKRGGMSLFLKELEQRGHSETLSQM